MHFPVLALFAGTAGRFGPLKRLRVDGSQRKVLKEIANLTGLHIVRNDLGQHLIGVLAAVRTLVVAEFNDRKGRLFTAH